MKSTILIFLLGTCIATTANAQLLPSLGEAAGGIAGAMSSSLPTMGGADVSREAALTALSPDTYDPSLVDSLIDASTLDDWTKDTLKSTLKAAGDNKELLTGALDQARSALGL